jgi:hypothetical protein
MDTNYTLGQLKNQEVCRGVNPVVAASKLIDLPMTAVFANSNDNAQCAILFCYKAPPFVKTHCLERRLVPAAFRAYTAQYNSLLSPGRLVTV